MKKNTRRILIGIAVVLVGSLFFSKKSATTTTPAVQNIEWPTSFIVGMTDGEQGQSYGNILATNGATITTSVWWVVQSFDCQPGKEVKKWEVIAQFTPPMDLQTENMWIQASYLGQQAGIYSAALQAWLQNVDLQIASLKDQKNTNQQQLVLLKQNLENAKNQKELTSSDTKIQLETLTKQLANVREQQKADVDKTEAAVKNQLQAAQNLAFGAITLVDNTFWVSDPYSAQDSNVYLGAKDNASKSKLLAQFDTVNGLIQNLNKQSATDASYDLQIIADYFSLAARVINNSISDLRYLPQARIDALFSTFNGTANSLIAAKTNFDTTSTANITIRTTYSTQITSLENQIASLSNNKDKLNDIWSATQINTLQSQINTLELSLKGFDNQLATLENSKDIQTQSTNGQLLGVEQNLAVLNNNLWGETLYSPIDGVVKTSSLIRWNKIWANVVVCSIWPKNVEGLKAQFFTSKELKLGSTIYIYDRTTLLGTGTVDYETMYVDSQTQNKGYEILNLNGSGFTEGQRVTFRFDNKPVANEVWIPLSYVTPKLDGYYVTKKDDGKLEEIKVSVGVIDNNYIEIISWLAYDDVIVK